MLHRKSVTMGLTSIALLGGGSLALSACNGNGLQYFSHVDSAQQSVYYALPSGWQRFDSKQVFLAADSHLSPLTLNQVEQRVWGNIFDERSKGSIASAKGFAASYPFGLVKAISLTPAQQDSFSLSSLRTLILPVDPLQPSSSIVHYKVISYTTFTRAGGFRGSQMQVQIGYPGGAQLEFEQVAMVNSGTTWAYVMGIGCTVKCFQSHQTSIDSIIRSFGVEAVK